MEETSRIYFSRGSSPGPFLEKLMDIFEERLKGRILLKPNLVSHEPYPTTTDPELFRELVLLLKPRAELAAGDAAAADLSRPADVLKSHLLTKTAAQEGIIFLDLYEGKMVERTSALGDRLKLSAMPSQFDLVISLPVLKTHINAFMTGALKNQFGFLDLEQRSRAHFSGRGSLSRAIVGVNQLCPVQLFVVDFRETLLNANELRHGGKIARGGWLFAGTDPVALDWFGFSLLKEMESKLAGKSPRDIPYLKLALESGLGRDQFELKEI
jgi:uncharacterized protein (DUF362 family)